MRSDATPLRVAVLDDYQGAAEQFADWSQLPDRSKVTAFADHLEDVDELVARLAPFDVVVAMRERTAFPREVLDRLPALRLLVTTGPYNAVIDTEAAATRGITVCGTGGTGTPTAELTWGLILAVVRHIPEEQQAIREGGWQRTVGRDLAGATLGVVGLGHLGTQVARVGAAFGMRVVAWSQNLTAERAAERGARRVDRDELLATADVLTIHLVLSDRTRGLIGARELNLMKRTAVLINTSRGPIVDERALADALERGRIAGAGIDVFEREPLPADHPLRFAPNTVLTPHLGFVTEGCYTVFFRDVVADIVAFAEGTPIRILHPPEKVV
jgi:phosphoglycerate dehydrogenase-like enzyme